MQNMDMSRKVHAGANGSVAPTSSSVYVDLREHEQDTLANENPALLFWGWRQLLS